MKEFKEGKALGESLLSLKFKTPLGSMRHLHKIVVNLCINRLRAILVVTII